MSRMEITTYDEVELTLENERRFYDRVEPEAKRFEQSLLDRLKSGEVRPFGSLAGHEYGRFRSAVRTGLRDFFNFDADITANTYVVSKLTRYFFQRYAQHPDAVELFDFYEPNLPRIVNTANLNRTVNVTAWPTFSAEAKIADRYDMTQRAADFSHLQVLFSSTIKLTKEQDMSLPPVAVPHVNLKAVETKTYIFGVDATALTDDQIFAHIARIETDIRDLEAIKTKSVKLKAKIDGLKADIDALVALVDARP